MAESKGTGFTQKTNTYHKAISSTSRKIKQQRNQNYGMRQNIGLGVLYTWEWAFNHSPKLNEKISSNGVENWSHFIYAGITGQLTTQKRLNEHLSGPNEVEGGKKNKLLYYALNNALTNEMPYDQEERRLKLSELTDPSNGVFKVVDVLSLFDLGLAEEGMIEHYSLTNTAGGNDFNEIVSKKTSTDSSIFGLNEAGGGQGGPLTQDRAPLEWLFAAYYSATEKVSSRPHVQKGRTSMSSAFSGSTLQDRMFNIISKFRTKSAKLNQSLSRGNIKNDNDIKVVVSLFLDYIGVKKLKEGELEKDFELDKNNNVIVASKFSANKLDANKMNTTIIEDPKLDTMSARSNALNNILSQIISGKTFVGLTTMTSFKDELTDSELKEIQEAATDDSIAKLMTYAKIEKEISDKFKTTFQLSDRLKSQEKKLAKDVLYKIYLVILKINKKRAEKGVETITSGQVGSILNRYREALNLGQFTKK